MVLLGDLRRINIEELLTNGTDSPCKFDASRALTTPAFVSHNPPNKLIQKSKCERHAAAAASDEEHALVFARVQTTPALWAVDHHVNRHPYGIYLFAVLASEAFLFHRRMTISCPGPITFHPGTKNDRTTSHA